jgi:hypothetical protein
MHWFLFVHISLASRDTYCNLDQQHTACIYTVPNQDGTCSKADGMGGITGSEEHLILDAHNFRRRRVAQGQQTGQPAAANMAKLVRPISTSMLCFHAL